MEKKSADESEEKNQCLSFSFLFSFFLFHPETIHMPFSMPPDYSRSFAAQRESCPHHLQTGFVFVLSRFFFSFPSNGYCPLAAQINRLCNCNCQNFVFFPFRVFLTVAMNDRRIQRKLLQFLFVIVIFVNFYIFLLNNFASEIQSAINSSATIAEIVVGRIEDGKIDGKIDWHDYKFMLSETDRVGPGEKGLPHVLTDPADIEINKAAHNELGFAVLISDLISPNRSLPDVRLDS